MPKWSNFFSNPVQATKDLGSSVDDAITQPIVNTVKSVGSAFDDSVLKTIKDAGSSIEDEFDRALADPVFGPIITVVASVYGGPAAVAALKYKQTGELSDALEAGAKAYIIQNVASAVMAPDPNAVGGVTGPDNIDVGGGFNPADGYIPPEGAVSSPVYSPDLPVGTPLPPLPEPTLDEIIAELAPPTEVGPELLGDAGGNTFPLDAPLEGEIPLGDATTSVSNPVYDYGNATPDEIVKAKSLVDTKGFTFLQALNAVRAGLFVNAITGDPLGLSGDTGGGGSGSGGSTGFSIVPVPTDWRSPTYAAPAAPIDINSLFTDMNLLGGTQWQGLATQKPNISFNDIFASGQQRTPMGTPVDINQIVSAILGQNTVSQKSA